MLMDRSASVSEAALTPASQRSRARGWIWLLTAAQGRPSGTPGSVLIVMWSVLLVFGEAQERADSGPGLVSI